jgi:hypothetical protein
MVQIRGAELESLSNQLQKRIDMNNESLNADRWSSFFDGDERVTVYQSEAEAIGEIEFEIDNNHEPGTVIEYRVAPMISGIQILLKYDVQRIGDSFFDRINEQVNEDMLAEEEPLNMSQEDRKALGQLIVDFISKTAKTSWWTVDTAREQKKTYISGSNESL